ncbi:MAG: SAVED domain-containing protein [Flavobacteriaceae bacterium]|nr:SAVED domain-containing protein [Flavobacteriaceae bacterium]
MSRQELLIGTHPKPPNFFGRWLNSTDHPETDRQCHRSLTQTGKMPKNEIIDWLANKVIHHHYKDEKIQHLKNKYRELGFAKYAEHMESIRRIPNDDKVRKGNMTEIILCEYVLNSTKKQLIKTFRFRYSTNIDQSMKGDDVLMVDYDYEEDDIEVYLGEAKFRKTPAPEVVRDITNALSTDKKPLSFTFLVDRLLESASTKEIGSHLEQFVIETVKQQGKITYSGLLLSQEACVKTVQNHLDSDNPKLVFLSLGVENPTDLMKKIFARVEEKLADPEQL